MLHLVGQLLIYISDARNHKHKMGHMKFIVFLGNLSSGHHVLGNTVHLWKLLLIADPILHIFPLHYVLYTPHPLQMYEVAGFSIEALQLSTNKSTYIKFHIKTLKIAPTCFNPKIILRELRCSLLKSF